MRARFRLHVLLMQGAVKDHPIRWLVTVLSIALGVGLGLAVQLIHHAALGQFEAGVRQFSGQADLQLKPHAQWLSDTVIDKVAVLEGVRTASPVLDLQVRIAGVNQPVQWLGLDAFTAASVTPNLVGQADSNQADGLSVIGHNTVFVSPAIQDALGSNHELGAGQLELTYNGQITTWVVAGALPAAGAGQVLAMSDIAAVQSRIGLEGRLSRVDIQLAPGTDIEAFKRRHSALIEQWGRLETPAEQTSRGATVSAAYRANLSILAMVALLTGGFLSFSTQMLSVAQRNRQWALLGAIGSTPRQMLGHLLIESGLMGLLGGLLGVGLGYALAQAILSTFGTDLGAGMLKASTAQVQLSVHEGVMYCCFGVISTVLGGLVPARMARKSALPKQLRTGSEEDSLGGTQGLTRLGLALCGLAALALLLPASGHVPIGGYLSVGLGLFGGLCLTALTVQLLLPRLVAIHSLTQLARHRVASTPRLLAVGLSGVIAAFSLVVAMHVMITSFRVSLDQWLTQVLPAPLYVKANEPATQGIEETTQALFNQTQGLDHSEYWGTLALILDPLRPPVDLIVRPLDLAQASGRLPLTGPWHSKPTTSAVPVWISEPMVDLYGWRLGDTPTIRLDEGQQVQLEVMGVWRDYTRQHGAIVVPKSAWLDGGLPALRDTQGAFWPRAGTSVGDLQHDLKEMAESLAPGQYTFGQPGEIRQASLDIFDRSFAITYLLEIAAVLIGLFGVATTFSAFALQRQREFALLSALGASQAQMLSLMTLEAAWSALVAATLGLIMGLVFAAVLVFVINPQSFHWSMDWYTPWLDLTVMILSLVLFCTATVALTLRSRIRRGPLSSLKEDWA